MAAAFTHGVVVIGAKGRRFEIRDGYWLNNKEAVSVDDYRRGTDVNQWVKRAAIVLDP